MEVREDFFDGMKKFFRGDFSRLIRVEACFWFGDTVLSIMVPPGLDGSPSELIRVSFFVLKDLLADTVVTGTEAVSFGEFEGAKDFHFEVW